MQCSSPSDRLEAVLRGDPINAPLLSLSHGWSEAKSLRDPKFRIVVAKRFPGGISNLNLKKSKRVVPGKCGSATAALHACVALCRQRATHTLLARCAATAAAAKTSVYSIHSKGRNQSALQNCCYAKGEIGDKKGTRLSRGFALPSFVVELST